MQRDTNGRYDAFAIVMSVSVVLGMVVALILVFLWRSHPTLVAQKGVYHLAMAVCPSFVLVGVVSALTGSTLDIVLTAGTMVVANGSLYAGLAAFGYWVLASRRPNPRL